MRSARLGLAALGAGMLLALVPAEAQQIGAFQESPGAALSRNLRSLAQNPQSLQALMGAGRAALDLGDAQAALTFFARAENLAPRDGKIKMWIGSALVQMQQPRSALKFFKDAVDLGVPDAEVAKERGLAWDISGEPRRAQADYRMALQRARDPEVTRRLALSLAISGERETALRLLEEQLLTRDHAGERTRALVLGLTGDAAGAARAAQSSMSGPQAAAMAPFLARLPTLNPAERALAVHLGHFPGDGRSRPVPTIPTNSYASATTTTQAGRPDGRQPALGRPRITVPAPASAAPRRRPGSEQIAASGGSTTTSPKTPPRAERRTNPGYWTQDRGTPSRATVRREQTPAPSRSASTTSAASTSARSQPAPSQLAPAVSLPVQARITAPLPATPGSRSEVEASAPPGLSPVPTSPITAGSEQPVQVAAAGTPAPLLDPSSTGPTSEPEPAQISSSVAVQPQTSPPSQTSPVPPGTEPARQEQGRTVQLTDLQASTAPGLSPPVTAAGAVGTGTESAASFRIDAIEPAATEVRSGSRLADVAAAIATLPDPEPPAATPPQRSAAAPVKTSTAPAKTRAAAASPASAKKAPAAPREPSRHWVQVAGGADKTALPRTFAGLKTKAPKLLGARAAWTVPLNATNRLLVGPFASSKEAQLFVNELAKFDLSAFAWTSEVGQKVERLPAK